MKLQSIMFGCAACAAWLLVPSAGAWTEGYGPYGGVNLVANGSFETLDGWTGNGGQAANGSTWINTRTMPDGANGYFLWHEETVARSFVVPENAGGEYRLSFYYTARPSDGSNSKNQSVCYCGNRVHAWVDGVEVGSVLSSYGYWSFAEFPVVLTPGEHQLCISGDAGGTGWDTSAAIDCVALEIPPDPTVKVNAPTIADYRARLAFDGDGALDNPGGLATVTTAATGTSAVGPDGEGTALTITGDGSYNLGETLNQAWSIATRFRAGENLGTVFALGTARITKAVNMVIVNDAADHLSARLYAAWGTAANQVGQGAESVEVGVPNLATRFHSLVVVFRRVSNGNYSLSLQRYDVYVDGVMVGQLKGNVSWSNRLYEYAGNMLQFGGVYGGNPNGLDSSTGHTFDDFRFFNRALSPDEARLYAETFPAALAEGATDDGATLVEKGETLTAATAPSPCFNFGTLELTDANGGTASSLPFGPGVVRFTGNQTLALTGLGNHPLELAGDVTLAAGSTPLNFRSSPITVTGGTTTLAGDIALGATEDRYAINGGVFNVTGGTVTGGAFVFPEYLTDNTINISGGEVTSAVRPTGSTRRLSGHCVNVTGGVFAPSSLDYLGTTDPGVATSLVVRVTGAACSCRRQDRSRHRPSCSCRATPMAPCGLRTR